MAQSSFLGETRDKVVGAVGRFFGLTVPTRQEKRNRFAARNAGFATQEEEADNVMGEIPEDAPETFQGDQRAWQRPQNNAYQAPQGGAYQQAQQPAAQTPQGGANSPQPTNPYQNTNPYQPAQNAPLQENGNLVFFPGAENRMEESFSARVISARGVGDCYSAITQLRQGDMVVLVMDHISDPAEMRHYVDMLSGACYSLRATITKLSRHGAYLICPNRVRVYVDSSTNQLNSASRQPQRPLQNPYGQSRTNASMGYGDPYQNTAAAQTRYANGIHYFGRQPENLGN